MVFRGGRLAAIGDASTPVPPGTTVIDVTGRYRHARPHRRALAPGRVRQRPSCRAHDDGNEATAPGDRRGQRRARASGRRTRACARGGGRRDLAAGAAGLGQPHRRARRSRSRLRPGRSAAAMRFPGAPRRAEDGLRREPQARLRREERPATRMGNVAPAARRAFAPGARVPGRKLRSALARRSGEEARRSSRARAAARPAARDAGRRAARQRAGADPLLPRRRDAADARRSPTRRASASARSTTRSRPTRSRPAGAARGRRGHLGRLVGLQAGGLRRHPRERGAGARGGRRARSSTPTRRSASSGSNQEAAKALAGTRRGARHRPRTTRCAGSRSTPRGCWASTSVTGSLEAGKMADVVLWSQPAAVGVRAAPSGVGRRARGVRARPGLRPSDFELGTVAAPVREAGPSGTAPAVRVLSPSQRKSP